MMANNWQRLNIWLKTGKTFNYMEFKNACTLDGCEPQEALEFAQKAGMISCGLTMYPELPVAEAYLKFISDNQVAYTPPLRQPETHQSLTGCGGCGGGQIR
jgi:hypothetical protein